MVDVRSTARVARTRNDLDPRLGWAAVAVLVVAWDLFNGRSLSSYTHSHRRAALLVGGVTVAHLARLLPVRADPFTMVARFVR
jgi:hypothetical protein